MRYAISIHDVSRRKICDLYDSDVQQAGQAYDIKIVKELSGWKEITFKIPKVYNGEKNYRIEFLKSENLIRLIEPEGVDWYVIQTPKFIHDGKKQYLDVTCNHISTTLKTKGLYTYFDKDTNGIGTIAELAEAALGGTGWALGECDTIYEADGTTEKVRSYSCDTKTGAYNMIAGICDLFFCHPVYHGDTKTVDIRINKNKGTIAEIAYGINSDKIERTLNSEDLITRLYVEGDYEQDAYVGIDSVNPTGMSFLLDFSYYQQIGAFTAEHQAALDTYITDMQTYKQNISRNMAEKVSKDSRIVELLGGSKYVFFTVTNGTATPVYFGNGAVAADSNMSTTDTIAAIKADGTYEYIYPSETATVVSFPEDAAYAIKFLGAVYGLIGGKEIAIEAKQATIATLTAKKAVAVSEVDKQSLQAQIDTTNAEISDIQNGTEEMDGLYAMMLEACGLMEACANLAALIRSGTENMNDTEAIFVSAMGEMLKDGYWNDHNYVAGQESALYADALDVIAGMSKPEVTYTAKVLDMYSAIGIGQKLELNSALHIYDADMEINDYAFVDKMEIYPEALYNNNVSICTDDLDLSSKNLSSVLSRVLAVATETSERKAIYERASAFGSAGQLSAEALDGQIDILKNKLASTSSSWYTDDAGNMIFESLDGKNAMMLCGSGFMCASGKDESGNWNWRTFGTGEGFTADLITAGVLKAGLITILGTDQFYWDADNIYIFDTENPDNQIRIGKYDGEHYGIGYTTDSGVTWQTAIGFDGVHFSVSSMEGPVHEIMDPDINELSGRVSENETALSNLAQRISSAEIAMTPSSIVSTVRESAEYQQDQADLQESIGSVANTVITQQTQITQLAGEIDVSVKKSDMELWLRIDPDTGVEIGRSNSTIKNTIDNTGWAIIDNGTTTADCRDGQITMTNGEFTGNLILGDFLLRYNTNNSRLSLLKR